jgi:hypothetical protein
MDANPNECLMKSGGVCIALGCSDIDGNFGIHIFLNVILAKHTRTTIARIFNSISLIQSHQKDRYPDAPKSRDKICFKIIFFKVWKIAEKTVTKFVMVLRYNDEVQHAECQKYKIQIVAMKMYNYLHICSNLTETM